MEIMKIFKPKKASIEIHVFYEKKRVVTKYLQVDIDYALQLNVDDVVCFEATFLEKFASNELKKHLKDSGTLLDHEEHKITERWFDHQDRQGQLVLRTIPVEE